MLKVGERIYKIKSGKTETIGIMNETDDELTLEYKQKIAKKKLKKIGVFLLVVLIVSVLTYQHFYRITVIGYIYDVDGDWFISEDSEGIIYALIINNDSDVNLTTLHELRNETVVIWGGKMENNKILVDKIKIYVPGGIT